MDKYLKKTAEKENSMCRFVQEINEHEFLPVASVRNNEEKHGTSKIESNLAKLSLKPDRKRSASSNISSNATKLKAIEHNSTEFTYLPIPKNILNDKNSYRNGSVSNPTNEETSSSVGRNILGRNMTLITGRVDFIIQTQRQHPNISAIYEVYGKVIRIVKGKYSCEQLIFLRGETGPVLQTVYYEVETNIPTLNVGSYVCVLGRFNFNKLHIFKVKPLLYQPTDEVLSRLQNICSFTLNKINKKAIA